MEEVVAGITEEVRDFPEEVVEVGPVTLYMTSSASVMAVMREMVMLSLRGIGWGLRKHPLLHRLL